jgi:SAM-dependent methyltransferase
MPLSFVKRQILRIIDKVVQENDKRAAARLDALGDSIVERIAFLRESEKLLSSASGRAPNELFKDVDDDFWLWLNTEGYRRVKGLRQSLPGMPPEHLQIAVAAMVGDETLRHGFSVYKAFRALIEKHSGPVADRRAILDFGCGWGRVMRFFLKDIEPARLWGIEMRADQVAQAQATNKWCNFQHVNKEPPTPLPDGGFDVIFAFSVFSHISEKVHKEWLGEFRRILASGGLIIVTTWGREKVQFLESVRSGAFSIPSAWDTQYQKMIQERFPGQKEWLAQYDAGRFCHVDLGYDGYEDYGETSIPEAYVRSEWARTFTVLEYISDRAICTQDVIVVRG